MKSLLFFLAYTGLAITASAQKIINDPNVELREVASFHAIEVSGGIDLYLSYGDEAVAVSAKDVETRQRIIAEVKDGVLHISYDWKEGIKFRLNNKEMRAYVSYKNLDKISAMGGCDIRVEGSLKLTSLDMRLTGGSDFNGKVEIENMVARLTGGCDLNISGSVKELDIEAIGGSDVNGYDLNTSVSKLKAIGGSDIRITVQKEISAEAVGGSDINWKGAATVKYSKASGAGSVTHRS